MSRYVPLTIAIILILGFTYVQGDWSYRWSDPWAPAEELAERIKDVPMTVGDWVGKDIPVSAEVRKVSGAVGYVSREYTNQETGERVKVWLICGRPTDMIYHNPEICYPGQGYHQSKPKSIYTFALEGDQKPSSFYTSVFRKESYEGSAQDRVYWAFAKGPEWEAPLSVRQAFAGLGSFYKMYFTAPVGSLGETKENNTCVKFGYEFIPYVNKALYPPSKSEQAKSEKKDDA